MIFLYNNYPGAVTFRNVLCISKYTTNAVLHHMVIEMSRLSASPRRLSCVHAGGQGVHAGSQRVHVMQAAHCTDANRRVHCHNVNIIFIDYVANNHGYKNNNSNGSHSIRAIDHAPR